MSLGKRSRTELPKTNLIKDIIHDRLLGMILDLEDKRSEYYNFDKIKEEVIKIIKENCEGMMNRCIECGVDMGRSNPRQLCGKTFCHDLDLESDGEDSLG